jgi:hypothetical protein
MTSNFHANLETLSVKASLLEGSSRRGTDTYTLDLMIDGGEVIVFATLTQLEHIAAVIGDLIYEASVEEASGF